MSFMMSNERGIACVSIMSLNRWTFELIINVPFLSYELGVIDGPTDGQMDWQNSDCNA